RARSDVGPVARPPGRELVPAGRLLAAAKTSRETREPTSVAGRPHRSTSGEDLTCGTLPLEARRLSTFAGATVVDRAPQSGGAREQLARLSGRSEKVARSAALSDMSHQTGHRVG